MECNHRYFAHKCKNCNITVCDTCFGNHTKDCIGYLRKVQQAYMVAKYVYDEMSPSDDTYESLTRYYKDIQRDS